MKITAETVFNYLMGASASDDNNEFITALLIYLVVKVTHAVDLECPHTVSCPCGSVGVNVTYVTVCVPDASVYEEVCASLSKCENCDEGLCSKCPEGLDGPFCSQEIHKSRQKRQSSYFTRSWRKQPRAGSIISSCPSMDSPKLGSIRCISSNELQTCTGKCLPGYRFTNSPEDEMVLTCRGGQWSPRSSFPACKSGGHCDLIVVGSGSFNCTTGMDGTRCDVQCSGSYVGRFFCYPGRNWEPPLPRCVKPKNPVDSTEGRQSCVCRNGEICNSRGQCMPKGCPDGWTRAECEAAGNQRKSCPDPGTIANGYRSNTDGSEASARRNFEEGQSVVYGCTSEEYELKGYFILTCKKDGTWSRSRPSCVKLPPVAPKLVCPDPGQIANANRLNTDGSPSQAVRPAGQPEYPVGHSLVYTCVPGYALERRPLITCLASGKWSYRTPFCRRIPPSTTTTEKPAPDVKICRDPGVDPNGLREESLPPDNRGFQAGTQLSYSCKEGYDLVGANNLFCLFQGWWSADRPVCAPMSRTPNVTPLVYCDYPGDIPDGRVFHIPTLNERRRPSDEREEAYPEGSRLQYSCNDGFTLQGPATLTCRNNGRWSTLPPRCALIDVVVDVYCPNLGPISNGHVVYRPAINNRRRPTPEPIEPDDPEFPVGGRLRYTCNSGYALVGRSNLVCLQSGSWSVDKPVCRIVERPVYCNYPGDLGNGQMVHYPPANEMRRPMESGEQYPADSRLGYSCDEGFTLEGPAVLECLRNGSWSAKPPTCITEEVTEIMYCENLGPIPNGRVQYFPPAIKQRSGPGPALDYDLDDYPEGSMLEYNCDEGYKLVGRRTLTCQSTSYWSAKPPVCELDCGRSFMQTTGKVFNGVNTTSGDWPWVVSISLDNNGSSPFICGGAVLNTHTVITAAHCLQGNRPLLLRFGKHHFNVQDDDTEVLTRRSSRVIIHPEYSNITLDSDIGLIYFQPRIRYSIRVQPICLPTRDSTVRNTEPGQVGYVGGWGETERAIPPEKMMLASLPVVSNEVCMDAYRQQNLVITRNMFCAGYDDSRQSVCQGDSGSPFVFYNKRDERYTLEGVVSFGVRGQCGVAGKYAIFTKVFRFILWITKNSK